MANTGHITCAYTAWCRCCAQWLIAPENMKLARAHEFFRENHWRVIEGFWRCPECKTKHLIKEPKKTHWYLNDAGGYSVWLAVSKKALRDRLIEDGEDMRGASIRLATKGEVAEYRAQREIEEV